ncbi:MAG: DUF721 domain-containing protein [Candidatus Aceula meridiana]|nr:DUF721 domain-containing protein [Candidatus Aceula meridiana]
MEQIKDIVSQVVGDLAQRVPQKEETLQRFWKSVMKGKAAKHTSIYGLKEGVLKISVDSPAWVFQLNLNKRKILKELQICFADVKDIRFKIGKVT